MRKKKLKNNIRSLCIFSVFLLHFVLLASALLANDGTWVTVEGEASLNDITKEEARNHAIEDAMHKAFEKVLGANISAEFLIVNLRLSGGIIGAPYGRVIDQKIIREGIENIHEEGQEKPSLIYKVKMKAYVIEETTGIDPSFILDASLNQSIFKDGEDMLIRIKPTRDCYVSIFTIFNDEKVFRLIPNQFKKNNFLKAKKTFSFPNEEDQKKGITLKVHTPEEKDVVTESIYILALKQPLNLDLDRFQEGIFKMYNGQAAFLTDLIKEVIDIPLGERAEQLLMYQIRKKK